VQGVEDLLELFRVVIGNHSKAEMQPVPKMLEAAEGIERALTPLVPGRASGARCGRTTGGR
jgi:hypothetical protein